MEVYKYEVLDGIEDRVKNSKLAIACTMKNISDVPEQAYKKVLAYANPKQIDLFYFESILASVGWNVNDAVFDKVEMWKARTTPADKPINFMHNESDIIGHMTSSSIIVDGKPFDELLVDENNSNVPEFYDIAVGAVLYKYWEDSDRKKTIANLIKEISEGKWYVSMECIFPKFDYALVTPDGQQKIIARNNDSSFLTKHLKFYGGSGEYNGHKVGMLMRDFVFSGKGIVDNPANKRSDITACSNSSEVTAFHGEVASLEILKASNNTLENSDTKQEKEIMSKYTDEQYEALARDLEAIKAKASETEKQAVEEVKTKLAKAQQDLGALQVVSEEKDKAVANLNTKITSLEADLVAAQAALETEKVEKIKAGRLAKLAAKNVEVARAESLVAKFAGVSDELFDELVAAIVVTQTAKCDEKDEKEEMKAAKDDKKEDVKDAEKEVANVKVETPKLGVPSDTENKATLLRAKASEWFAKSFESNKKK